MFNKILRKRDGEKDGQSPEPQNDASSLDTKYVPASWIPQVSSYGKNKERDRAAKEYKSAISTFTSAINTGEGVEEAKVAFNDAVNQIRKEYADQVSMVTIINENVLVDAEYLVTLQTVRDLQFSTMNKCLDKIDATT